MLAFEWPNGFLLIVLCAVAFAAAVPFPRKWQPWVCLVPLLIAFACWLAYELYLTSIAPINDPLIRIDLFLILPLMLVAVIRTVAAWPPNWFPRQFSLRTLVLATTLVAVVLGMIIYATRH